MTTIPMLEKELKEVYRDLKYYKNYSERLRNKLQQKENIIKEVREYINKNILISFDKVGYKTDTIAGIVVNELLEILDKGE